MLEPNVPRIGEKFEQPNAKNAIVEEVLVALDGRHRRAHRARVRLVEEGLTVRSGKKKVGGGGCFNLRFV